VIGLGAAALVGGALAVGLGAYKSAKAETDRAYARLAAAPAPPSRRFDAEQVAHLPEIARRYFQHAIAPGTPLYSVAEVEMEGTFLLGGKDDFQTYSMSARQVLRPPDQFVWVPKMRSGMMTISGSDALVEGQAWTRFWLLGLVPVANERSSPDLVRSAQFRAAVEGALWLPASLLPGNDVEWEQVGPDEAQLTFRRFEPAIVLRVTLDETGAVKEMVGQRWSNVNAEKEFRLQPFGGTISSEASFQGFTLPTRIAAGNHFGEDAYLPFFQAHVLGARYR
jgi:hypothetical protein